MRFILALTLLFSLSSTIALAEKISLNSSQIAEIGERIFLNECSGKDELLLSWNEREDFLSLGIGHFIWYPKSPTTNFEETFPKLIEFLQSTDTKIPAWLNQKPVPPCPWATREEFTKNINSRKAQELLNFLSATKDKQSLFLIARLQYALPAILEHAANHEEVIIRRQFELLSSSMEGTFALIDYVNFKGLGIKESERYNGEGWGLRQVLTQMAPQEDSMKAVAEFAQTAENILIKRVKNSPAERREDKWLPGWINRVRTYTESITSNNL